jgi:Peptidase A4 family
VINNITQSHSDKSKNKYINLINFTVVIILLGSLFALFISIIFNITSPSQFVADVTGGLIILNRSPIATSKQINGATSTTSAQTANLSPVVIPSNKSSVFGLRPSVTTFSPNGTLASNYDSSNWSGYMANGSNFTGIAAQWTVPEVISNNQTKSGDATWIGIGGITSNDLIQIGTQNTISSAGKVSSSAFYEILPAAPRKIDDISIIPGTLVAASIKQINSGLWLVNITNLTANESFNAYLIYNSSRSSAEWIEEDPTSAPNQLLALDDFGTVSFSSGTASKGGSSASISSYSSQPITMVNQSNIIKSKPSSLTDGGSGFSINWQ